MGPVTTKGEVMVIEDDYAIRETLRELLQEAGYPVTGAANGREALAQLKVGHVPRLILLDLMMPVMDGLEFRAAQQLDPVLAPIPVIVISAGHESERIGAMAADGYLAKPFKLDALLAAVDRYC